MNHHVRGYPVNHWARSSPQRHCNGHTETTGVVKGGVSLKIHKIEDELGVFKEIRYLRLQTTTIATIWNVEWLLNQRMHRTKPLCQMNAQTQEQKLTT
jgi:hypothetical protein